MDGTEELTESFSAAVYALTRHFVTVEGIVTDVDTVQFTCTVQVGGDTENSSFYNVPLRVLIGSQSAWVEIPVINTSCLLNFRDGNLQRPQLVMVDQIQDLLVTPKGNVIFNGGNNGGMVLLLKLVERMNLIENAFNQFVADYNTHIHPVTAVGSPTGVPVVPETGNLTPTQRTDIENTKIQQ